MRKFFNFIADNAWTYAGTGMVLITLSGPTLKQAIWLAGVALVLHSVITLSQKDE
jgi:hypothetical protein